MKRCFACFREYEGEYGVCPHCGQIEIVKPKEPIQLYPGTVLANRYIIGTAVGAGGFGIIYRAWDTKLETIVAVKEFYVSRLVNRAEGLKNLIITKKSQAEFEYRKERFLAEARNMAKFGSHKNIPNVFEFFEENNTAYIVMELLNGVALNEYLKQCGGKLDIDFALMIVNEVGNGLKSLHESGIIHRDVAPDNIYICSDKDIRIKLLDLGAAKLADTTDDVIDIILKPGYSPTEQYDNGKNIGPWTDIYALGATLYVMLTGVKPDESTNRKIADEVKPPHELNPQISENLSNAIMKAMAVEKHMRFKSVAEFLSAVNGQRKVVTLAKEHKRRKFRRLGGVFAACLVVLVAAVAVWSVYSAKRAEQYLKPASISIWYSVADGSTEEKAMNDVIADFTEKFPDVQVEWRAIPESEYAAELENAAQTGTMPTLFESTDASAAVLAKAGDISAVLESEQALDCLFLDQYESYYSEKKQVPLAIEVPLAYVITNGAVYVDYTSGYFTELSDFGADVSIALDEEYKDLIEANFGTADWASSDEFLNNSANTSPVMLSTTMVINEVRQTLTNYEKTYVYPDCSEIRCNYIYEWSIAGDCTENEAKAAERLLSWMLGNVYQSYLMISECNDGQIPMNATCFYSKIENRNLASIGEIYGQFVFTGEE